jgi:hypothetical protein
MASFQRPFEGRSQKDRVAEGGPHPNHQNVGFLIIGMSYDSSSQVGDFIDLTYVNSFQYDQTCEVIHFSLTFILETFRNLDLSGTQL